MNDKQKIAESEHKIKVLRDALSDLTVELAASDEEGLIGHCETFMNARQALKDTE